MFRLRYHLLTLLTLSVLATARRRPRFEPLPICSKCVSREDILAPGIGFDLTTSYGTAAIRYYNGSVVNPWKGLCCSICQQRSGVLICGFKVDANQEYEELIIRMSDPSSQESWEDKL